MGDFVCYAVCFSYTLVLFIKHAHELTNVLVLSHMLCCLFQLRTQALASLHSGLPNNQGLPVAHAARWLGMEVS